MEPSPPSPVWRTSSPRSRPTPPSRWARCWRGGGSSMPGWCSASPGPRTSARGRPCTSWRRYGRPAFRGKLGRRLLSERTIAHIEREYERHGGYGIFVSRLLPVWRGVVMPFAGLAGVSAPRALVPLALASALWYGLLTYAVVALGANLEAVLALLRRVNHVLGIAALAAAVGLALWIWRRLKR